MGYAHQDQDFATEKTVNTKMYEYKETIVLEISNGKIPHVGQKYKLGDSGPFIVLLELQNISIFRVRKMFNTLNITETSKIVRSTKLE